VISHFNPTSAIDRHGHLRSIRRVQDGILDQISEGIFEGVSVSVHLHRLFGADKSNGPLLSDGPGRHCGYNGGRNLVEIDSVKFERYGIQPGDAKELLDQPVWQRSRRTPDDPSYRDRPALRHGRNGDVALRPSRLWRSSHHLP